MIANEQYYEYLRQRSRLGLWYRHYWLYPRLCRYVTGRVLDVGCGIGDFLQHRPGTVGVDINPATVEWCQQQGLDAHLMVPDQLPFDAQVFDSVILDNVLEHLKAPKPLLQEIHRVMRPQGRFLVGVPGPRGYASDPDHKIYYNEAALVATMTAAGFSRQQVFHMPLRLEWLSTRMRQYCVYGVFQRD
ncbi:MAG: class I SAM-dependent methyltransferase [Ferrovibrio sp.]|uniref:class I SAM-dependent methyltransferase n=1 Tax=Ferrovibrio sp. TaxID=1917215 RepID=UPI00391A86A7